MKLTLFRMLCNARYSGYCVVSQCVLSCSQAEGKLIARCEHKVNECGSSSPPVALLVFTQVTNTNTSHPEMCISPVHWPLGGV